MTQMRTPIRVLLVDDELEFLDSTARALARRGFEVQRAEHGEIALRLLQQRQTDVVVLDVKMPGMDGVDVFREIRLRWPHVAVILLTGHGTVAQAFVTSKEGVFEYLTKPCDIERLEKVLRIAAATVKRGQIRMQAQDHRSPLRLLFVDDDVEFLGVMSRVLTRRGIEVTTVSSGPEALAHLNRVAFGVVLADVKMPEMNGIELLREIKRLHPLTEVIFLTGHPSVDVAVAGVREGAYDYLVKPIDINDLFDKIADAHMLHLAQMERRHTEVVEKLLVQLPD